MTDTASRVTGAYVGASGFSYREWRGAFYPADARPADFLRLYAERLPAVELNATFYRLPSEAQLEAWSAATPPGFRFAVKLSRQIVQGGRVDLVPTFCERVRALGDRLGPILVQPDPDRPRDDGFLRLLLDSLPDGLDVAFDLRHPSWAGADVPLRVDAIDADASFCYLRLREPPYDDEALAREAGRIAPLLEAGVRVHCFVNRGEAGDHSPAGEPTAVTAERLLRLLER